MEEKDVVKKKPRKSNDTKKITESTKMAEKVVDDLDEIFEKSSNELKKKTKTRPAKTTSDIEKVTVAKKASSSKPKKVTETKKSSEIKAPKVDKNISESKKATPTKETSKPKKSTVTSAKAKSEATTKKASTTTKPKASKKVSTKATAVKKKISEEVAKTTSEKSSKIKINKANTDKKKAEKIDDVDEYKKELNINYIEDELEDKFDINEIDNEIKKRKQIPKEDIKGFVKKASYNLIYAVLFIAFLIFSNYGFYNFAKIAFIKDLNIFAFVFLGSAIMLIEVSYKKEDVSKCISGIETLLMAIFTLVLPYIYQIYKENFINVIKIAGIVIFVYYLIKSCIVFFNLKNKYLRAREDFVKEDDDIDSDLEDDDDFEE